jgi:hypothetical protein
MKFIESGKAREKEVVLVILNDKESLVQKKSKEEILIFEDPAPSYPNIKSRR